MDSLATGVTREGRADERSLLGLPGIVGLFDGASVGAAQSRLDEQIAPATPHVPLAPTGSATPSSKLASKATVGLGVAAANFSRADTAATMTSANMRVVEADGMANLRTLRLADLDAIIAR